MHGHLSYTKASALDLLLANGVSGLRDCAGALEEIDAWRAQVRMGVRPGPRVFRCGPALAARSSAYQRGVASAEEGRQAVRDLARAGVDFVKVHAAIPREAYFAVVEEARTRGLTVAGHLPRAVSALEACDAGQRTFEHVDTLLDGRLPAAGGAAELAAAIARFRREQAPAIFERFARRGVWFTPTLCVSMFPYLTRLAALADGRPPGPHDRYVSQHARILTQNIVAKYRSELTPASVARHERTFDEYLRLVRAMHEAGVRLLAGSDFATSVTYAGFDLHEELRLLSLAGLPPLEVLRAATHNAARCLGQEDLGTIRAGQRADLVLLDRNPLDVAERMIEQAPGVTRLLDRLEARGLVRRKRCPEDRRQVLCFATPAALRLLEELDAPVGRADREALGMLDRAQLDALIRLLDRVRSA